MSHALLLRLFLSPYFSISVAMHYLKTYSDSIGISHYLCWRMKGMPPEEVESYWPQICHLLITYPTQSNALETFVLQRAEESTHSAMLTFWFMQAALRDLSPTRQINPRPFLICQRVLHRCHEILFGDPPLPTQSPYQSLPTSPSSSSPARRLSNGIINNASQRKLFSRKTFKVNPHLAPALVGAGVIMAAQGMPELKDMVGQWAIAQGQKVLDEEQQGRDMVEDAQEGADAPTGRLLDKGKRPSSADDDVEEAEGAADLTAQDLSKSPESSRSRSQSPTKPRPAKSSPHLPEQSEPIFPQTPPRHSVDRFPHIYTPPDQPIDPFSQLDTPPPASASRLSTPSSRLGHQAYYSVPDLTKKSRGLRPSNQPPSAEDLLSVYDLECQRQLLRSHYCKSEIKFLLALEDISNRLLVVPKLARVPALRAELTSLNHNLPAEVCMPLWCTSDHSHESEAIASGSLSQRQRRISLSKKGHSRVVRISPGDSVVLNSAERAPFLLHVEILEGDLDFDPTRRENRDLLKRLVVQEDMRKRKRENGSTVNGVNGTHGRYAFGPEAFDNHYSGTEVQDRLNVKTPETDLRKSATGKEQGRKSQDVEEVDLVEQLYGATMSVKDKLPDLSDIIPLPKGPKNKALDAAAWDRSSENPSRRASLNPSPLIGSGDFGDTSALLPSATLDSKLNDMLNVPASPARSIPGSPLFSPADQPSPKRVITLEDYSERMRTAAVMLAQLQASLVPAPTEVPTGGGRLSWIPGTGWILGTGSGGNTGPGGERGSISASPNPAAATTGDGVSMQSTGGKLKLAAAQAEAIRSRIMEEMMALEEERVARMTERQDSGGDLKVEQGERGEGTAEDEGIVRRELNKADPSAAVFKESWTAKKSRIRANSPWGHLANWDVISVIVKTGTDLRQEQLATQLIERFGRIFKEEKCDCWVRYFRILITGEQSGLVETITDAVSVHSIKKGEYARRIAEGGPIGQVSLMDHFVHTYGKPDSGRFARAQRAFIRSLAAYSIITYLLQIKDRHNGNILVDREGHLIHIDFGFMLSNSPGGNMGFEAAPFKLPLEYVEIMGGLDSSGWAYFKKLFKEGFEAARKHSDSLITMVELMQKNSRLDCFVLFGDQTAHHLRERFALGLTTQAVDAYLERLIVSSTGSNYTRLYDTFQYYSQGVL